MNIVRKFYGWLGKKVNSPHAQYWLAFLFFIEAVFFVPVDPLLILFCIENSKKSLTYSAIATISSVAGGVFGYFIGAVIWLLLQNINFIKIGQFLLQDLHLFLIKQ